MQQRTILRDCLLAIFASVTLFGQATTSIRGVVTDSTGGVLVDATVTVENPRTGFKRKSVSDPNGVYRLAVLPPGVYEITATAARFSPVTYSDVALRVGEPATFDVRFDKVGVLKDEITVVADSAPLNTTDASLGHTVGSRKISQLPFNKRNVVNMLSLQPGVTFVGDTRNLREDR